MDTMTTHDATTLFRLAEQAVRRRGVPERWREDAVSEYVAAAYRAGHESDGRGNVQVYQCRRGQGAVAHFVRRERRHEQLAPGACPIGAVAVSLSIPVPDPDGEPTTLAETLIDDTASPPDTSLLAAERRQAVRRALRLLTRAERRAVFRVWVRGSPQRDAAVRLGINRNDLRRALETARDKLRKTLLPYQDELGIPLTAVRDDR